MTRMNDDQPSQFSAPLAGNGVPQRIGPYRILAELGRGGMGVVFLAEDPTLERQLAIKILSDRLTEDPAALARFAREAKLLAALNHPNIATIYALEEADSVRYITMEFVEGESLADRLARGSMPLEDSLRVARQIAAGLEAAHEKGVIHRDLKPGNVRIRPDGRVTILDFGIAKSLPESMTQPVSSLDSGTSPGTLLGTPGYMSPEQLRGNPVDERTDIWAFGCVLFECVAGAKAFPGTSASGRIAATLETDPDESLLPPETPSRLIRLLRTCLARTPSDRLGTITEARRTIEEELAPGRYTSAIPAQLPERRTQRTNLPPALTSFVGREQARSDLAMLLNTSRLLTLTGVGGAGKSRLALELSADFLDEFVDGVWWVDLAPLADPTLLPQTIATALGIREWPGAPLTDTICERLRSKTLLLVLDNCEHLLDACAEFLERLLQATPTVHVLATSREALSIPAERVYRLAPLGIPRRVHAPSLETLRAVESVKLFEDRARMADPDFAVTTDNMAAVTKVCRHLDGIPLALELAAARVRVLNVQDIAERIEQRFVVLKGADRQRSPRHKTLRALIDWSHDQLTAPERTVFARLSIFSGGWTLEAAEAICACGEVTKWDVLDLFTRLVEKSLVERDTAASRPGGPARYRMLETIRQYAAERLEDSDDSATTAIRHRDYYLALAEAADRGTRGPDQRAWLDRLDVEHDNLRMALDTCRRLDANLGMAVRLATAAGRLWWWRGHLEEGLTSYELLLTDKRLETGSEDRGDLLVQAGWLAMWRRYERAHQYGAEAVAIYRKLAKTQENVIYKLAAALTVSGSVAMYDDDIPKAIAAMREALEIGRQVADDDRVSASAGNLAECEYRRGHLTESRRLYEQARSLDKARGDAWALSETGRMLARVAAREGQYEEARALAEEALAVARGLGDRWSIAQSLESLALVALMENRFALAVGLFGTADSLRDEVSTPWSPAEQTEFAEDLAKLRSELGEEAYAAEWTAGRAMTVEQVIDEVTEERH